MGQMYVVRDDEERPGIDKWNIFKQVACMAASGCATVVAHKVVKANLPAADNMFEKVVIGIGTYFVTGVVGAKVAEYCDDELEQFKEAANVGKESADGRDD